MSTDVAQKPVPAPDPEPQEWLTYVSLSYRYLRLGMVALVGLIFVSVILEVLQTADKCWQGSISAYYYTPVQFVFVASLVAIGVAMIVLKGSNEWEDAFLNVAGLLAPIVALVPTVNSGSCSSVQPMEDATTAAQNVGNNVAAYGVIGAIAFALTLFGSIRSRRARSATPPIPPPARSGLETRPSSEPGTMVDLLVKFRFSLVITAAVAALAAWAFIWHRTFFVENGHPIAAFTLFGFIILVVCENAVQKSITAKKKDKPKYLVNRYTVIAIAIIVSGAAIIWAGRANNWEHWVLLVEAAEITLFAGFWLSQTFDEDKKIPHLDNAVVAGVVTLKPNPARLDEVTRRLRSDNGDRAVAFQPRRDRSHGAGRRAARCPPAEPTP